MDERPDSHLPLAGMLGEGPPEHGLRGRALLALVYGCGAWAFAASLRVDNGRADSLAAVLLGAMAFGVAVCVAEGLRRFRSWAWFFAAGWLGLLCPVLLLAPGEMPWPAPVSYLAGVMGIGWIHSLWTRRGDFLPDERVEALRRRPRWVTREWRAARLARMNTVLPLPRAAAPVAGALWTRGSAGR